MRESIGVAMAETTANELEQRAGDHSHLVGSFFRFGDLGPAYEVLKIEDGENATIRVLESEEVLTYPIAKILRDPEA